MDIDSDWKNKIFDYEIDCIILDTNISSGIHNEIREKFKKSCFFLLPSFSNETYTNSNSADLISEPFKFSELEKNLNELYESKAATDAH